MLIALIIAIPVTNIITGYLVFKAVQVGLRWNMQLKKDEEPVLHNPIKEHFEAKKEQKEAAKIEAETKSAFAAFYGPADIFSSEGGK